MKTALITGASRGIGAACAEKLAENGFAVVVNYQKSKEKAENLALKIRKNGGIALPVCADIGDPEQVENMFSTVESELGQVEVLINNAGIAQQKLFTDITLSEWNEMFKTDVTGVFLCCKRALSSMIRNHHGSIINISSMWGQVGASCEVHYSAAKAAVIGLTKALAKEVGPSGIRVNCIAPGVIQTEMNSHLSAEDLDMLCSETPLEMLGTPQDIAEAAYFLACEKSKFITGQILGINGGMII